MTDQNTSVASRVRTIVLEHLGHEQLTTVSDEALLVEDLGADSLDAVELLIAVEHAFDVEVSDDTAEVIRTVGDLVAAVERLVAAR